MEPLKAGNDTTLAHSEHVLEWMQTNVFKLLFGNCVLRILHKHRKPKPVSIERQKGIWE